MAEPRLSPAEVQALAIATFARVRGEDTVLGRYRAFSYDLEILPVEPVEGVLTMRLTCFEADGQIRDVKQQDVVAAPGIADDALLSTYFEALALGFRKRVARGDEAETLFPSDFVPARTLVDVADRTAEEIAEEILAQTVYIPAPAPTVSFDVGDKICVYGGPFANFSGTVQEVSTDTRRLKVHLSTFGRTVVVELDFAVVEKR